MGEVGYQTEISWEGEEKLLASCGCWGDIKDVNHGWVDYVDAVIELG